MRWTPIRSMVPRSGPAQTVQPLAQGALEYPDVGVGEHLEAALPQRLALRHGGDQLAQRLPVAAANREQVIDRLGERRVVELAGDAQRQRQVELAQPDDI